MLAKCLRSFPPCLYCKYFPYSSAAVLWLFIVAKSLHLSGFLYSYVLKKFQVSLHWYLCNCFNKMIFFFFFFNKGSPIPIHSLSYKRLSAIPTPWYYWFPIIPKRWVFVTFQTGNHSWPNDNFSKNGSI